MKQTDHAELVQSSRYEDLKALSSTIKSISNLLCESDTLYDNTNGNEDSNVQTISNPIITDMMNCLKALLQEIS